MAKVKAERLDPPMTRKERDLVRRLQAVVAGATGAFQFAADPGVRSMAAEMSLIFSDNVNRCVQAYRDGKEE